MGEIGYNEQAFLNELQWWQIRSIIRGYRRRDRTSWLQTRWQTWCILSCIGAKIDSPEQLLPLPFDHPTDNTSHDPEEDEQLQKLIAECQEYNRQQEEKQKTEPSSAPKQ